MTQKDYTRYNDLERFLNVTSKSGYTNVSYVVSEMAKLIGLDPDKAVNTVKVN